MNCTTNIPGEHMLSAIMNRSSAGVDDKLAVLLPGFLDSKDYLDIATLAETLERRGYFVIRFDPAGTWESGGEMNDYTMTQYLKDTRQAIRYAERWVGNPFEKIVIGGHSFGAQVAISYACRDERVSGVVAIMPPYSAWGSATREEQEKMGFRVSERDGPPDRNGSRTYRVPFSFALDRSKYDTLEEVRALHIPLLLVTGSADTIVSPDGVKKIYDAANEPKELVVLEGIGHDYRHESPRQTDVVNDTVVALMNKHCL